MANSKIPAVLLNDTLNLQRRRFNQLLDSVGDVSTLKTTAGDVTAAVNELYDSIGVIGLGSLNTSAKTIRQAINEHETDIGNMSLNTTASDITGAINEIHDSIGEVALSTTATTIKTAINELDAELGTISAGAMGTTASTVSTAIAELETEIDTLNDSMGTGGLSTTAQTIVAAINELNDSIGSGSLNTTAQTLIGAINEIDADTTDAVTEGSSNLYFTNTRARDALGVTASTGLSYTAGTGKFAGVDATTSVKGVASFNTNDFTVLSGAVSLGSLANNQLDNSTITLKDSASDTGEAVALGQDVKIIGTASEVTSVRTGDTVQIGLTDSASITSELKVGGGYGSTGTTMRYNGDIFTNGNLTVDGDLTISGTTTTVNTATFTVEDKNIVLGSNLTSSDSSAAGGAGIFIGDSVGQSNFLAGFRWNGTGRYWEATDSTGSFYQLSIAGPTTGGLNFKDDDDDNLFVNATTGSGTLKIDGGTSVQTNLAGSTLTVSVDDATTSAKGKASFASANFNVASGAVSSKDITIVTSENGAGQTVTLGGSVTLDIMDSAEINQMIDSAFGSTSYLSTNLASNSITLGTNTTGSYVSTITAGTGLTGDGTGEGSTPTLTLDFSELTDMTGAISGTTEFILQDGTTESRKAMSEIITSTFNGDGLTRTGDITLDASGDIILDADGDDIIIKNGSAGHTVNLTLDSSAGNFKIDAPNHIQLDNGANDEVQLYHNGTEYGSFSDSSGSLIIKPSDGTGSNVRVRSELAADNIFTEVVDLSSLVGTETINWRAGQIHIGTDISSNFTVAFSNIPSLGFAQVMFMYTTGSNGGVSITWPASVKWPGGTKPQTPRGGSVNQLYQFITYDGGTNVYGFIAGQNFS